MTYDRSFNYDYRLVSRQIEQCRSMVVSQEYFETTETHCTQTISIHRNKYLQNVKTMLTSTFFDMLLLYLCSKSRFNALAAAAAAAAANQPAIASHPGVIGTSWAAFDATRASVWYRPILADSDHVLLAVLGNGTQMDIHSFNNIMPFSCRQMDVFVQICAI